uniref:POU class 2 homeobox associating factor 1 n=1 Tax=Cynoglossus semilaevis TaxID=244447 RepID=A0A3P8UWY8_CYNSE
MHWDKSTPSTVTRPRPYQGVRVRDPVKELLRRKRSREPNGVKTVSSASVVNSVPCSDAATGTAAETLVTTGDGLLQCSGWKTPSSSACAAMMPWSSSEYRQQESCAQSLAYPASTLTTDLYMQTLCPSYTMLTYTHTPLLTNFGTLPMAPAPASLPQMELPDSGLTYVPWAQPITAISAVPNPGVQFSPGPSGLSTQPLVQMPLSLSLTPVIPGLEDHGADPQAQNLDLEEAGVEPNSPNFLDKLLENHKEDGEEENKESYGSSLFIANV